MCVLRKSFLSRLLQQLFIREDWQRRGIGKTLIEDGLSMIEQLESSRASDHSSSKTYKVGLTSSPQGKALYERYGFKDVYWFNPIFDDIDEQGKEIVRDVRWPLMIKQ